MKQLWFGSIVHVLEQPSEFKLFPSSHYSLNSTILFPHRELLLELFMQVEFIRIKFSLQRHVPFNN